MGNQKYSLRLYILVVFLLIALSCNMPLIPNTGTETTKTSPVNTITNPPAITFTSVPPVITETATLAPNTPTSTMTSTNTVILPTFTNTPVPIPCNRAAFVSDVSHPDGTDVTAGFEFTKKWRITNTGSCTWTSGYHIIFDSGDRMSAPDETVLTSGSVPPGATVDIAVKLKAPTTGGTYKGYFRLKSPDNIVFGIGASGMEAFWVQIDSVEFRQLVPVPLHILPSFTPTLVFHFAPRFVVTIHP